MNQSTLHDAEANNRYGIGGTFWPHPVKLHFSVNHCNNQNKNAWPCFFKQIRIGQHARHFTMVKFRTMTVEHAGSIISVTGESRITAFGAFLRKYKLDDLPTLFHVVEGKMSFVGPRPDVPDYADKLNGENRKILGLRPGITGPASLKYANEEELLSKVRDPQKYNDEVIFPDKVKISFTRCAS